jgi:hypothetical protein
MACLGVHFAITEDQAQKLLDASGDDELVEVVQEEIEGPWDEERLFQSDKAWDALHRCLSDGSLDVRGGSPPLNLCFFGGQVLNSEPDYFVVLVRPEQVQQIAEALEAVTREWLRERYDALRFPEYQSAKSDEDFQYTWGQFEGLPDFFARAAEEKRHVIFTVDQ